MKANLKNLENRGSYTLIRNIEGEGHIEPRNKAGWDRYLFRHHSKQMKKEDMMKTFKYVPLEEEIFAKSFDDALADLSRMGYHADVYNFAWIDCVSCCPGDIIVVHDLRGERKIRRI
jgi:hypothetical protein